MEKDITFCSYREGKANLHRSSSYFYDSFYPPLFKPTKFSNVVYTLRGYFPSFFEKMFTTRAFLISEVQIVEMLIYGRYKSTFFREFAFGQIEFLEYFYLY